jgi:sporulation protein YlmC with PRC-barrel domain
MRLSDLLERPVVGRDGRALGQVHDLHLVQDGPLQANEQAALRVHGMVVGRGSFATRLGYAGVGHEERGTVEGPPLLRHLVRWLHRHARYVPWTDVVEIRPDRIVVEPLRERGASARH